MTRRLLAPARWLADRAWMILARRVLPAIDDNLYMFDGQPVCARLDSDITR